MDASNQLKWYHIILTLVRLKEHTSSMLLQITPRHLSVREVKSSKMALNKILSELPLRQQNYKGAI